MCSSLFLPGGTGRKWEKIEKKRSQVTIFLFFFNKRVNHFIHKDKVFPQTIGGKYGIFSKFWTPKL